MRTPVKASVATAASVPFSDIPNLGKVVRDTVEKVEKGAVLTTSGASLPFDYLVLAPGCAYGDATFVAPAEEGTLAEREAAATKRAAALAAAPAVVVVGGGPVGVEAAAEIAVAYPDKPLTLVTAADTLLAGKPASLRNNAATFLESKGAKLIFGQKVVSKGAGGALTCEPSAQVLPAGALALWCVPGSPNTGFLSGAGGSSGKNGAPAVNPSGFISVDAHLRVPGTSTWFALGDAAAIPGVKLGYLTRGQAGVVVGNIKALEAAGGALAARPDSPLPKSWTPNGGLEMMFVTLGPSAGTAHVGSWISLPSVVVAGIKSRDLFIGKTRKGVGAPPAPLGSV